VAEKRAAPYFVRRVAALMPNPLCTVIPLSQRQTRREELAERTRELLAEAAEADPPRRQEIYDEVVTSHLWLAEALARRLWHSGEDREDLLQVACTGLVEACMRFDPEQASFVAFAVPTITGVLKRHYRDHGWAVRPPRHTQELASTLWQQWPTLVQAAGGMPNDHELAEHCGEPVSAVRQARLASQCYSPASIDAAMSRGVPFACEASENELDRIECRMIVRSAMAQLDPEERRLILLRFFEGRSQSAIAAELGISQMQISRLLARVLTKLRRIIGCLDSVQAA
jgi:RNA polymerase sigma-B factor